jgi:hypothetical protein
MGVLGATAPVNIASEKSRWEADMDSYNPRFRYKDSAAALAGSNKVKASSALLHLAVGVLRGVIGKYGSERLAASPRRIPPLSIGDCVSTPQVLKKAQTFPRIDLGSRLPAVDTTKQSGGKSSRGSRQMVWFPTTSNRTA